MKRPAAWPPGLLVGALLLHSLPAEAQFLDIPEFGNVGDVTVAGREGWHQVLGMSHGRIVPIDAASGLPSGKRQHKPVSVVKPIDKASPLLARALTTGQRLPEITVAFDQHDATTGRSIEYYRIVLTNVAVSAYEVESTGQDAAWERVGFSYETITWTAGAGNEHTDAWTTASQFDVSEVNQVIDHYDLSDVYPNPFGSSTEFDILLRRSERVTVDVVNVLGRHVQTVLDKEVQAYAPETVRFGREAALPQGLYVFRIRGETFAARRTVILIR